MTSSGLSEASKGHLQAPQALKHIQMRPEQDSSPLGTPVVQKPMDFSIFWYLPKWGQESIPHGYWSSALEGQVRGAAATSSASPSDCSRIASQNALWLPQNLSQCHSKCLPSHWPQRTFLLIDYAVACGLRLFYLHILYLDVRCLNWYIDL